MIRIRILIQFQFLNTHPQLYSLNLADWWRKLKVDAGHSEFFLSRMRCLLSSNCTQSYAAFDPSRSQGDSSSSSISPLNKQTPETQPSTSLAPFSPSQLLKQADVVTHIATVAEIYQFLKLDVQKLETTSALKFLSNGFPKHDSNDSEKTTIKRTRDEKEMYNSQRPCKRIIRSPAVQNLKLMHDIALSSSCFP